MAPSDAQSPFIRRIEFEPAYDRRSPDPHKNYGIHGLVMRFVLIGPIGAVHFVLATNWQLPEVTRELAAGEGYDAIGGDPHWMERPMATDLGYHSPVALYEGASARQACPYLNGQPCYYDGSALNAEPVFHRLLREGDTGVWAALEDYYTRTFDKLEVGGFGQLLHTLFPTEGAENA